MAVARPLAALGVAACAAAVCSPASAGQVTLGSVERPTEIAAFAGVSAWSAWDATIRAYRLMLARDGAVSRAPIAPSPAAFDVDLGPGPRGEAVAVFSRCRVAPEPRRRARRCDLWRYDVESGTVRRIDEANTPGSSEQHPTLWRDRLAFTRTTDGDGGAPPVVYVRRLGSRTPSVRRPGPPTRRCEVDYRDGKYRCQHTRRRAVHDLELHEDRLAEVTYVTYPSAIGFGSLELRLVTPRAAVRQVAQTFIGLSGVDLVGPSFEGGGLYFEKTCNGECLQRATAVYRYDLSDGSYRRADGMLGVFGFARDGGRHVFVAGGRYGECGGPDRRAVCAVRVVDPPAFAPASRPPR